MTDDDNREEFSVAEFYGEDSYVYVRRWMFAKDAVELAKVCTDAVAANPRSRVTKVIITDGGDNTVFQWEPGKGVVFPSKEELKQGGVT